MSRYGVLRVLRPARAFDSSAVIPAGKHLFPFRTEKLSLPGPMVLGGQPPGRVGRRRFAYEKGRVSGLFSCRHVASNPVAPGGIELAQAAHALRDRRVRDEECAESALGERVEG